MSEPIYLYDKDGNEFVTYAPSEAERLCTSEGYSQDRPVVEPEAEEEAEADVTPKPKPARRTRAKKAASK